MLCCVLMYIIALNSHSPHMSGVNPVLQKGKDLEVKQFTQVGEVWSNLLSNVCEGPNPSPQFVESDLLFKKKI